MAEKVIPSDATIDDVMPTLNDPLGYVRGVLGRLHQCKQAHGDALVRIGTTGRGLIPYYRVVYGDGEGTEQIYGAYYGDNHAAFDTFKAPNNTWSTGAMTYDQVQLLIGKLRGFTRSENTPRT
jgi:hypothetical protein